ncbi:MAG TPA: tyrosine-type recombinase/integrase [Dermatophilaceae bacterium]|nr:tyrosine-type recombinase/integrase [Dermatophilaceae bacterium]
MPGSPGAPRCPTNDGTALFLSSKGERLSSRAIDFTLRHLGKDADVEASAHALRHTCLTRLAAPETTSSSSPNPPATPYSKPTRRYSLPSDADRQTAMDALTVDY